LRVPARATHDPCRDQAASVAPEPTEHCDLRRQCGFFRAGMLRCHLQR